jgi:transcriptional regulator with XRE-family HTH domain
MTLGWATVRKKEAIAFGQRLRAAVAYSGNTMQSFADSLNEEEREEYEFSKSTLDRYGQGVQGELPSERRMRFLAEKLDVPAWFLRDGFKGASGAVAEDVSRELLEEIRSLREDLRGGELLQLLRGRGEGAGSP